MQHDALASFKLWLNYSVTYMPCCITHSGTLRGYGVVSETLVGVTQKLRIIKTVSEYLRNIDKGGPRCVKGVNAPARVLLNF